MIASDRDLARFAAEQGDPDILAARKLARHQRELRRHMAGIKRATLTRIK